MCQNTDPHQVKDYFYETNYYQICNCEIVLKLDITLLMS